MYLFAIYLMILTVAKIKMWNIKMNNE
jgi:hypothetical protein